ncbi:sugar transferase [Acidothermaceae bacterium B102]|nr:sugar transferase [Acidothermaceae bacterium B102]
MVFSSGTAPAAAGAEEPGQRAALPRQHRPLRRGVDLRPDPDEQPIVSATTWENRYAQVLVFVDCTIIYAAMLGALALRFGRNTQVHAGNNASLNYSLVTSMLGFFWLLMLGGHRAYEPRFLGSGVEEYRRVFVSCFRIGAIVAIVSYGLKLEIARGFIGVALPAGTVALLISRYTIRKYVHRARDHGRFSHRLVVAGDRPQVIELVRRIRREAAAGYQIVGVALPQRGRMIVDGEPVPVLGTLDSLPRVLTDARADSVAVTASSSMTGAALRRLGWQLEGTGIDLVVAPALADVAGPRISIRPVAGLPLLHVEEPEITGFWPLVRTAAYWVAALLLVVVLSPLLLFISAWIAIDSRGPVLFRQTRVGAAGREFTVFKFRTMVLDAEDQLAALKDLNESDPDGLLFKMRNDPRVTRSGRFLRKYSLDELPQLLNVLRGNMALVGPRPPLPSEVAAYEDDVRRRLMVRPGITGLWQVSGRSDLTWEESVRLDLYYVENWSPALDISILWKTLFAVLRGGGAY